MIIDENKVAKGFEESDIQDGILIVPEGVVKIDWGYIGLFDDYSYYRWKKEEQKEKVDMAVLIRKVKGVKLPDSLIEIGNEAFADFKSLEKVVIPDTVTKMGGSVFAHCQNLTELCLSKKLKIIPNRMCAECPNLNHMVIPDSVTEISDSAFIGNHLRYLYLSKYLKKVETKCFSTRNGYSVDSGKDENDTFIEVILPANWSRNLLQFDRKIGTLVLPENYKDEPSEFNIAKKVKFRSLSNKKGVIADLQDSVKNFQWGVYSGSLRKRGEEKFAQIKQNLEIASEPDNVDNQKIIGRKVLEMNDTLEIRARKDKSVLIEGVDSIGDFAFAECQDLTTVKIAEGVKYIGRGAFANCPNLISIEFPKSLEYVDDLAFVFDESIKGLNFAKKLNGIGDNTFNVCPELEHAIFNGDVKKIGAFAFASCDSLSCVQFLGNVEKIEQGAFNKCKQLLTVSFAKKLGAIKAGAFKNCEKMPSINLPESTEEIGEETFSGCESLLSISLPKGLKYLGKEAFKNCKKLLSVVMDGKINITRLPESTFENCESLTGMEVPDQIGEIGTRSFAGCKELTTISSKGAKHIGNKAFQNCESLTTAFFPSSVQKESDSFEGCPNVIEMDNNIEQPNIKIENGEIYTVLNPKKKKGTFSFETIKKAFRNREK
ncbi:MAG: leucine-rich repeat domain-containing protein [Clostridia bacterium]|nr:leucine-rich repeat domain-containing protein [Clostridia bacterium]